MGLGQASLDQVGIASPLPAAAGKARMDAWHECPGGQIATALLACRQLERSAAFIGSVGGDAAAERVLEPLREAGVDIANVRRIDGAQTQRAMIWIDRASGERTVFWHREAALTLRATDVPEPLVANAGVLLMDAGDPAASLAAAQIARAAGAAIVLDADGDSKELDTLLAAADFPVLSRDLAQARFGGAEAAARALARAGARLAVVTLGAAGSLAVEGERTLRSPALAVAAIDTTGAGDAFHGAFCDALLSGHAAEAALAWSNAAAGLNCTGLGAQGALPDRARIERSLGEGATSPPPGSRAPSPGELG